MKLFHRYESETRENILVTNQSSTYIEFKLKRSDSYDNNQDISKIRTLYNQSKEFVLHQTLFLIIAGVCGS